MNQRLKELADQAELTIHTGRGNTYMSHPEFNKKFAELIVRECASIFEGVYTDQQRPERIDTRIKQHFGVEEPKQSAADRILSTVRKRG